MIAVLYISAVHIFEVIWLFRSDYCGHLRLSTRGALDASWFKKISGCSELNYEADFFFLSTFDKLVVAKTPFKIVLST